MRIRRRRRKEITGAFCTTCQTVSSVEQVEIQAEMPTFTLRCRHMVTLAPGAMCRLDVQVDKIILYPNQTDLLVRQGATL